MTTFSAAPQALGYLYQARVALLLLLQAPDEAQVKVEALDDIELSKALPAESLALVQLKQAGRMPRQSGSVHESEGMGKVRT